jgi:streptogramin lyase
MIDALPDRSRILENILNRASTAARLLAGLVATLWIAAPSIAVATPGEIASFPLPKGSEPEKITTGSDGNLWFTTGSSTLGRISPSGEISQFPTPTSNSRPFAITAGPDGNVWFTELAAGKIGRVTPSGDIAEFPVPICGGGGPCNMNAITAGPDGNVWFTVATGGLGEVGRVTPQGSITLFPLPEPGATEPRGITTGPDGNLWVAQVHLVRDEPAFGQIARVNTSGDATVFNINSREPSPFTVATDIAPGPDGKLWFVGSGIGTITTDGVISRLDAPDPSDGDLQSIVAGPDGNMWFASSGVFAREGVIGRITPSGHTTFFRVAYGSRGLTAGPDGNIWLTEWVGSRIGRITPGGPVVEIASARAQAHRRSARLILTCNDGLANTRCRGVISMEAKVQLAPSTPHGKRPVETVVVARGQFNLVSGQRAQVKLRLTRRGLLQLHRRHRLQVRVIAVASFGQIVSRKVTLRE